MYLFMPRISSPAFPSKSIGKPSSYDPARKYPSPLLPKYILHPTSFLLLAISHCMGILYSWKFFFFLNYLFIYLWLCWVFISVQGPSPVVASGGHSSSWCVGLSLSRPLLLQSTGSRRAGSVIVAHGPRCSAACGIFPDQGLNPCPLHWQADSQPLRHQGSPMEILNSQVCELLQGYSLCLTGEYSQCQPEGPHIGTTPSLFARFQEIYFKQERPDVLLSSWFRVEDRARPEKNAVQLVSLDLLNQHLI